MWVSGRTEEDFVIPIYFLQYVRLTHYPYSFTRVPLSVAKIIHSVRLADFVQASTKVKKCSSMSQRPRLPAQQSANDLSRTTIEGQPALGLGLLVIDINWRLPHQRDLFQPYPCKALESPERY